MAYNACPSLFLGALQFSFSTPSSSSLETNTKLLSLLHRHDDTFRQQSTRRLSFRQWSSAD